MALDRNVGNLSIGFTGETRELDSEVLEAARAIEDAFGSARPEITPVVVAPDRADAGDVAESAAPEAGAGLDAFRGALMLMTRQSAQIGQTLVAGFEQAIPLLGRMEVFMSETAAEARRANLEAWKTDAAERAISLTSKWGQAFVTVESSVLRVVDAQQRLRTVAENIGSVFAREKAFTNPMANAANLPRFGAGLRRKGGEAASGAAQGLAQSLTESSGGSGLGGFLGALAGGGLAGGVAVLVQNTLQWAQSSKAVMGAWDAIKSTVMPTVTDFLAAIEPASRMLVAVGQASVEAFSNLFAPAVAEAGSDTKTLAGSVIDWVKTTVDGGNIVLRALRGVGVGIATLADHLNKIPAVWYAVQAVFDQGIAALLRGVDLVGGKLVDLVNMIPGVRVEWTGALQGLAAEFEQSSEKLLDAAGNAWNSSGYASQVDAFFDGIEARAKTIASELAKPAEDLSWLDALDSAWNKMLDNLADKAKGLFESLMSPAEKLAQKFNELDQLRSLGFLSQRDYEQLKGDAADKFLGKAATANPAALEAGSKEARSAILEYQSGQRDPLKLLPDLTRQQTMVAERSAQFLERIASAVGANANEPSVSFLGN